MTRRDWWSFQIVDSSGRLTGEASAAFDDLAVSLAAFAFTAATGASTGAVVAHAAITLAGGGDEVWPMTVRGEGSPQIRVAGGAWVTDAMARAGDTLEVRLTASGSAATTRTAAVYGPGRSAVFSVTTA